MRVTLHYLIQWAGIHYIAFTLLAPRGACVEAGGVVGDSGATLPVIFLPALYRLICTTTFMPGMGVWMEW